MATLKKSSGKIWFQENKGQMPGIVQYAFNTNFGAVYIENNAIVLKASKVHEADEELGKFKLDSNYTENQWIRITFEGGAEKLNVTPANKIVDNINFFTSPTPEGFVYGVKAYSELFINDVYPGVDLRLYSVGKGQMEFDWILERGADYSKIRMKTEGHEGIEIAEDGGFNFKCRFQTLSFRLPESYQFINGVKKNLTMKYGSNGNTLFFEPNAEIQADLPLVIDPTVLWATYMDESDNDYLFASESDNCGRVYLAGRCRASAATSYLQGATGYDNSYNTGDVAILYIFSADGDSIKAFSYFGSNTTPADMDLFPDGRVLVAGSMRGKSGGTAGSIPATSNGGSGPTSTFASYSTSATLAGRGWMAIFNSEFSHLHYSSHMPGTNGTFSSLDEKGITCIDIVDNNTYYVAGITDVAISSGAGTTFVNSSSTPDNTFSNGEAFISRFTTYNTWQWGTYVGGDANEIFMSIKLSSDGTKLAFGGNFEEGATSGAGFPARVNPVDNVSAGDEGFFGWLTNQSTNPGSFGMLSFIGGTGDEGDVLVESMAHNIYLMGYTNSSSFPGVTGVTGHTAYQSSNKGDYDVFISKCAFTGSAHAGGINGGAFKSTFFGGSGTDISGGIIFNTNDSNVYLFITTGSASVAQIGTNGFPTVDTDPPSNFYDRDHDNATSSTWVPQTNSGIGSNSDISFASVNPDLTQNIYTSFCGGSDRDYLGNTGRLNGAGHYGFNRFTNIYSLGTTIHSNDLPARGSNVFSDLSFDQTSTGGDDHFIVKFNLSNTDMGDAPATFDDSDPARHGTNSLGFDITKFGHALTDYDSKPEYSIQADGDDNRNTGPSVCQSGLDDEDGLISVPTITVETTGSLNLPIYTVNTSGSTSNVYAWIDFDGDGVFEVGEAANALTVSNTNVITNVSFSGTTTSITGTKPAHGLSVGDYIAIQGIEGPGRVINGVWQIASTLGNTFTFTVNTAPSASFTVIKSIVRASRPNLTFNFTTGKSCPSQIIGGRTYLRMRITNSTLTDNAGTTNLDERSRGVANTGEIEDHVVYIRGRDYGDLPSGYGAASVMVFNDINANNIPEDTGAVWLGATVDIEKDCAANNSALANGDDLENDDEDGVTIPSGSKKAGSTFNIGLSISRTAGFVAATRAYYGMWIDWNADGDFTDASDGFFSGSTTGSSVNVSVTAPLGSNFSPSFAVRTMVGRQAFTSTNYNLVYTNGEIEDYINDPGILISGNVYDDGDGTYDAAGVDFNPGSVINRPSGTQLWAYLVTPGGATVLDSIAVLNNGTYYLQGATPSTNGYEVRISTTRVAIGAAPPAVALPTNWVSVGETNGVNNGAGTGIEALTPASNSRVAVNTGTQPITAVNFGINLRPESFDTTAAPQSNPAGSIQYPVLGLRGFDLEQGMFFGGQTRTIIVETLPTNADLYYDSDGPGGNAPFLVVVGQVINNYVASRLSVDPTFTGAGTVTFTYAWRDSAQTKDLTPATVTLPFTEPTVLISGTVFDDGDGNTDNQIDGVATGTADATQLYAYLDSAGVVVRKVALPSGGNYSFAAVPGQAYHVLITQTNLSIGDPAPSSSSLPTNWVNTGEQYGSPNSTGSGIEAGTANGRISITTTANSTNINFGIDKRPESDDKTASSQVNPGGTVQVAVPNFTGTDLEDGSLPNNTLPSRTAIIETVPNNATLFYDPDGAGALPPFTVVAGQVINNYQANRLTVDPNFNGGGTVSFTYAWRDTAGFKDQSPATVLMPFTGLNISGTVFQDADGLTDNDVDGTARGTFVGTQLRAYLVNASNTIIAAQGVAANGTYSFNEADANSSYTVLITQQVVTVGSAAPGSSILPSNLVHVGEDFGTNNNAGTGIVPTAPNGIIAANTVTSNITNVDFGVEFPTFAHDKEYTVNPNDITGLTGNFQYPIWLPLYAASGTNDTTYSSLTGMPGKVSGFDLEDGRFDGSTGNSGNARFVLNTLPPAGNGQLQYGNIDLIPNPTVSDPSWIYWNQTLNRYEIPSFDASNLKMLLAFAYQNNTIFTYSYIDAAGIGGRIATYLINYSVPLPVSVSGLVCKPVANGTTLKWTVYDLYDLSGMKVMRSSNGNTFTEVASISEFDKTATQQTFEYTDKRTETGTFAYRVDVINKQQRRMSSSVCIEKVNVNVNTVKVSVVPNPTQNQSNLIIQTPNSQAFEIQITDATGREIKRYDMTVNEYGTTLIDLSNNAPGVYNIRVRWNGQTENLRLMKL